MIIKLHSGESVRVPADKAQRVVDAIDAGVEWLQINGNRYKTTSIAAILNNGSYGYKTPSELRLPDLGDGLTQKQRKRLTAPYTSKQKYIK